MPKVYRIGGSFAPPLTDEKLARYKELVDALEPSALKDALSALYDCCNAWWNMEESTSEPRPHPVGRGYIVQLDPQIEAALWDKIPWREELEMYERICDTIDPVNKRELRDAAYHMLWLAKELELGREPITTDKL